MAAKKNIKEILEKAGESFIVERADTANKDEMTKFFKMAY